MSFPASFFFPDRVTIAVYLGAGGAADVYAEPAEAIAEVIDETQLIRNADGEEVVSSTRVTVPLNTNAPVGSLVTVWPDEPAERTATVLRVNREKNPAPLPSHLVLWLE